MNRKLRTREKIQGLHFHHHSGYGLRSNCHDRWCVEIENIRWHIHRYENEMTDGFCVEMSLCDGSCLPPIEDIPAEVWHDIAVQIKTPPMVGEVVRWIERKKAKTGQAFNQGVCSVCKGTKNVHRNCKTGTLVCQNCRTKDPSIHEKCSVCGNIKFVAKRAEDAKPVCPSCYKKTKVGECAGCKKEKIIAALGLCWGCYRAQLRIKDSGQSFIID